MLRSRPALTFILLAGCAISDPDGPSVGGGATDAAALSSDGGTCGPPLQIDSLPACCETPGGAHCVPDDRVPPGLRNSLDRCSGGGLCVPDPLIEQAPLRTCTSIGGAPGACTSLCVPQVRNSANVLPSEGCDAETERCAPCVSPIDGSDTGACAPACSSEPTPQPPRDGGMAARCCDGMGSCIPGAVVGDRAAQLALDVCPAGQGLVCVPDVFLDGSFTPPACSTGLISILFGPQYKPGRCLPGCLPAIAGSLFLGQDDCGSGFKCAPCLDPTTGQPTPACQPL